MKTLLSTAALAAVLAIGALGVTAGAASASVVCNAQGDCWHVDGRAPHEKAMKFESHPDDWYFHQKWDQDQKRHWRGYHEGHGYYANGVWVQR
jgi:hypothetical protein